MDDRYNTLRSIVCSVDFDDIDSVSNAVCYCENLRDSLSMDVTVREDNLIESFYRSLAVFVLRENKYKLRFDTSADSYRWVKEV